uniref:Uncharacterized protein LOC100807419 n=1 Tax=Rhizophora mucronata TaxID=61149 RepID=A0A2P2MKT6_RHIMU
MMDYFPGEKVFYTDIEYRGLFFGQPIWRVCFYTFICLGETQKEKKSAYGTKRKSDFGQTG